METKVLTTRQLRERKFLLRAPVFAIPLVTVLFWGLGGGSSRAAATEPAKGFTMRLPPARLARVSRLNKLDYYMLAAKDSVAAVQRQKTEENYARQLGLVTRKDSVRKAVLVLDPNVRKVQEKLAELNKVLAEPAKTPVRTGSLRPVRVAATAVTGQSPAIDRLERMMKALKQDEGGNAEIAQLSAVLDKLVAAQKPVKDTVHARLMPEHRVTLAVKAIPDEEDTFGQADSTVIEALAPNQQVLVSGGELRLELVRDIDIGGQRIPRGTPVIGVATLNGERLRVQITGLAWQGRVFPVNLQVADQDGLPGIYIPGAPLSDAVRESAGEEAGSFGPTVLSTTLAGQAAGAGMNLARSLIGKKIRPVRVTIQPGTG